MSEKASDDEKFCYENSERKKTVFDRQAYKAELAIITLIYKKFSDMKDACDLTEEFEKTLDRKLSHLIAVDNVFSDKDYEDEYKSNAVRRSYSK